MKEKIRELFIAALWRLWSLVFAAIFIAMAIAAVVGPVMLIVGIFEKPVVLVPFIFLGVSVASMFRYVKSYNVWWILLAAVCFIVGLCICPLCGVYPRSYLELRGID
nr:MAG TPA: hypothetical protein [Caudoviricetes sp.]